MPAFMFLAAHGLSAQDFNPLTKAQGWAHQDRDASFIFYNPATRSLVTWDRGFGVMNSVSVAALSELPEKWLPDKYNNLWVVSGTNLTLLGKDGKVVRREKLPAEVSDLAWDGIDGFVLTYRTAETYAEFRNYRDGGVVWSFGNKPTRRDVSAGRPLVRVLIKVEGGQATSVLLEEGGSLAFTAVDPKKGRLQGVMLFDFNGAAAPALDVSKREPMPLCFWYGKNIAFTALTPDQLPGGAQATGLLLARMDLASSTMSLLATGLSPEHRFIGVSDKEAVFIAPQGGLVFVPVR